MSNNDQLHNISCYLSHRIGFVTFRDGEAAKKALEADENDLYLDHRYISAYAST